MIFTVTTPVPPTQFAVGTVTEYVVVVNGVATGLEQLEQLNVPEGLHTYVPPPPFTVNVVELPTHTTGFAAVAVGGPGVVIVIVMLELPVEHVPETVTL